ncbi:Peptidase M13 [Mortierella alpina]|nr:Peptidase M13 [Mortierella alpina]
MNMCVIAEIAGSNGSDPSIVDANNYAEHRNLKKMRALYSSCMNESRIESIGVQPLLDVIKEIIDLFPVRGSPYAVLQNLTALEEDGVAVINSSSAIDKQAFTRKLAYFSQRGLDSLLSVGVMPDNTTEPRDSFPTQVTPSKGVSSECIEYPVQAFSFEYPIRSLDRTDKERLLTTILGLSEKVKSIDWPLFFRSVFPSGFAPRNTVAIGEDVAHRFDDMLKAAGSPLSVQGYFVWRAIEQLVRQIAPKYTMFLIPANDGNLTRTDYCARVVNSQLGGIAGHFLVKKTFHGEKQVAAEKVAKYVRKAFVSTYGTGLMDGLSGGNGSIVSVGQDGCLEDSLVSEDLETFYKDYAVDEEDFFGNRMRYAMWHRKNLFAELDEIEFMNALQRFPQNVRLHRNDLGNVQIPVGLLQPPFFDEADPSYVNYATLGVMLAREYARDLHIGLDKALDEARTSPNSSTGIPGCLGVDFSEWRDKIPEKTTLTLRLLRENIYESIGLQQAFLAWTYDRDDNDPASAFARHPSQTNEISALQLMPNKTDEQMFFTTYADSLCEKRRDRPWQIPQENKDLPRMTFINGALATFERFAEAFGCSADTLMNPLVQCYLIGW